MINKQTSNCPRKTAKHFDRHFVQHNYHDYSKLKNVNELEALINSPNSSKISDRNKKNGEDFDSDDTENDSESSLPGVRNVPQDRLDKENKHPRKRGGVAIPFPLKLHQMLNDVNKDGLSHVVSWQPHGRCFIVHLPKVFVADIMSKYFKQSKLTSFQRQLNLYGFNRLTHGKDAGGYYHELFLKGKLFLCTRLIRMKVNGRGVKGVSSPELEPDFYSMQSCETLENVNEKNLSEKSHLKNSENVHPQEVVSVSTNECQNNDDNNIDNASVPFDTKIEFKRTAQNLSTDISQVVTASEAQHFPTSPKSNKRSLDDITDALTRLPLPPAKRNTATFSIAEEKLRNDIPTINSMNIAQSQAHYQHLNRLKGLAQQMKASQAEVTNNSYRNMETLLLSQLNHCNQRLDNSRTSMQNTNLSTLNMLGLGLSNGCTNSSAVLPHLSDQNSDNALSPLCNFNNSTRLSSICALLSQQKFSAQKKNEMTSSTPSMSMHGQNLTANQSVPSEQNVKYNLLKNHYAMNLISDSKQTSSRAFAALKAGRLAMGNIDSFKKQLLRSLGKLTMSNGPTLEPMVKDHLLAAWIDELLHFLSLKVSIDDICTPSKLSPGKPIGIAWQELMLNPKAYANICKAMLGENSIIDYHPVEDDASNAHTLELYSTTWKMYKLCFEVKEPPNLFWPMPRCVKESSENSVSEKLVSQSESKNPPRQTSTLDVSHHFPLLSQTKSSKSKDNRLNVTLDSGGGADVSPDTFSIAFHGEDTVGDIKQLIW
eukprot:CAMPEP_0194363418 /NCGR_PEP_ID=MMETSP0174-20130528/11213_1 /TAXON_ID=216777 /ORGANISM="Proboscia alata, Strain PI-D3" /LENGTH=765 /DNA_ID=CAMNT_0039136801 /DNA_START=112 /DNA_END=2406 /DNA_ORIENTATION=+